MKSEIQLFEFYNEIWIKCPKCSEPGLIQSNVSHTGAHLLVWNNPVLACTKCNFHLKKTFGDWEKMEKWFGPWIAHVNTICKACGTKFEHLTKSTMKRLNHIGITCSTCTQTHNYELEHTYGNDIGLDPYFGFELFYNKTIKGNLLWVINRDHCEKLISHIGTEQRDDNSREKWSVISNLPRWLILSKNRGAVLKSLNAVKTEMEKNGLQQRP